MNIIVAPDSFKNSMSSTAVCQIVKAQWLSVRPSSNVKTFPLADGGEGTSDIIGEYLGAEKIIVETTDPLNRKINAHFYMLDNVAYIEMAAASGLTLLTDCERDPHITSTYGTGQLLLKALDRGATKLILGLGGTATNDAAHGLLTALGIRFLDDKGLVISSGGLALSKLVSINTEKLDPRLSTAEICLATDVTNRFSGAEGATNIFGPQKFPSGKDIGDDLVSLEKSLQQFRHVVKRQTNSDLNSYIGGGAAGGAGAALQALMGAKYFSGIDLVISLFGFEEALAWADLVITGEGRLDSQSMQGKVISGVLTLAQRNQVPVFAVVGSIDTPLDEFYRAGLKAAFSIINKPQTLDEALENGAENLAMCIENIARVVD